ncbi:MAG: uracil-DNA glycosylase [Chloroflexota bacterium]|nr:uracil-DNA glycosylase [Chloroflexota bacterium]MDE2919371.1 uracil-DNA glycosylase [Chloroflexota bacterium]
MAALAGRIQGCRRCPRLVAWREEAARTKRAAFRDQTYWGRPVAGFGDPEARVVLVGLAPAAHGANRTGRVFTGDRSGDFLFGALHRKGFANQAESRQRGDGLEMRDAFVTAIVRCAPPANKPSAHERTECRPWLEAELDLLPRARVAVALGGEAWRQLLRVLRERGLEVPRPAPRFGHGVEAAFGGWTLLGAYHPSQQNTFTGRLTPAMLDAVLARARELAAGST